MCFTLVGVCVDPELAKRLSEIYNYNVFWLSSNFLTHICSVLESKPSFMSPAFTRKNLENQFPNSSATRAQAYELGSPVRITLDLEVRTSRKRQWVETILLARGTAKLSFRRNGTEIGVAVLVASFLGGAAPGQQLLPRGFGCSSMGLVLQPPPDSVNWPISFS